MRAVTVHVSAGGAHAIQGSSQQSGCLQMSELEDELKLQRTLAKSAVAVYEFEQKLAGDLLADDSFDGEDWLLCAS